MNPQTAFAAIPRSRQPAALRDYHELTRHFDPKEFTDGPRSNSPSGMRVFAHTSTRCVYRKHPVWFRDDRRVIEFLSQRFPKLHQAEHPDRDKAALWAYVMRNCLVNAGKASTVAEAVNAGRRGRKGRKFITAAYVRRVVQMIFLAVENKRLDGKPRTGRGRGRPKKENPCTFSRE